MEQKERPLILEMDEAKQEIVQSINNALQVHKISCYCLDLILNDICGQIKALANKELAMAQAQVMADKQEAE